MGYGRFIPLQYAAEYRSTEVARILLDAGADVNGSPASKNEYNALQAAAGNGNIDLVKIVLSVAMTRGGVACPSQPS